MRLEILKYDNTKLNENQNVGTGSKLIIKMQTMMLSININLFYMEM